MWGNLVIILLEIFYTKISLDLINIALQVSVVTSFEK